MAPRTLRKQPRELGGLPPPGGGRAVIAGASSGIGAAFARRLAARGHDLLLVARRADRLEALALDLAARHGIEARSLRSDLSTMEGVDRVIREVRDGPPAEVLINSAGFGTRGLFVEIDDARTVEMIQVHVVASVRLVRACLPAMIERRRGAIINVSSLGAFFTTSRYVTYSATKSCVNMFSLGLQDEVREAGVVVQALCPGMTKTGFLETEEYAGFDYSEIPEALWMSADRVVDESLRALGSGQVVVVPGQHNRAFVAALTTPIVGRTLKWSLALASRLGEKRSGGSGALF